MITKVAIVLLKLVLDGLCDPNLDDVYIHVMDIPCQHSTKLMTIGVVACL